jgi:hypothetical protein
LGGNVKEHQLTLIKECKRPECFKKIESDLLCFNGYDDNGIYGYLGLDFMPDGLVMVHLEVTCFSHTVLKNLLEDWRQCKEIMRNCGVKQVFTTREGTVEEHITWLKFIKHFGFLNPRPQVTLYQEL